MKRLSNDEFLARVKEKFGDKIVVLSDYVNNRTKVKIKCSIMGEYYVSPKDLFKIKRHQEPTERKPRKVRSKSDVCEMFKEVHGDRYSYNWDTYAGMGRKMEILCEKHGAFYMSPSEHLKYNCPSCKNILSIDRKEYYLLKMMETHGNVYVYDETTLTGFDDKVRIFCHKHGEFHQSVNHHLRGSGCPKCSYEKSLKTRDEWIRDFLNIHGDVYDYSLIKESSLSSRSKVEIVCPKHGVFVQRLNNHCNGQGCPRCVHTVSKPENEIYDYLKKLFPSLEIRRSCRKAIAPLELDLYIPKLKCGIEFNGSYWHYDTTNPSCKPVGYHGRKSQKCRENGMKLLHIREDLWLKDKSMIYRVIHDFLKNCLKSL